MPELTRRRALLAVASGAAALAGCTGQERDPITVRRQLDDQVVEDYEVRTVRNERGEALFARDDTLPTVTEGERGRYARSGRSVVVSEDDLAELTFGDSPEAEGLRSFATGTDFESASLYLLAMSVESCYEIRLRSVSVEWDRLESDDLHPSADFCRTYRPADVDCAVEEMHTVGFAIRLPVAAESSSGSGRGMARGCGPSPHGEYFEGSVTPADGDAE